MKKECMSRTALLLGWERAAALAEKKVLLFGVGGVGSFAAEALCRAGIGHMVLVDGDVYDLSNINRQLGATMDTIGRPKVEVMKERLLSINPDLDIAVHQLFYEPGDPAAAAAFPGCDYIVDAVDSVRAKVGIITEAYQSGIPVISAMGAGNKLYPERFEVAAIEQTSVDPLAKVMRRELKKRNIGGIKAVYSKEPPRRPSFRDGAEAAVGSISFVPSAAGMVLAGAVIRDLLQVT